MITLIRQYLLWAKKTKWELALWQFLDKELTTIIKRPEEIEKKIMPYLAVLAHSQAVVERNLEKNKD